MGSSRVASKIKMATVDELLGVPAEYAEAVLIEIDRIAPFKNHPFKVLDDERMDDLVESIKANGVLNPVIVRPTGGGQYEMISGHRRLHASKLAGLDKIPAISKQLSDDEATIIMVDSNIQREEILPSEKAFALRMRHEALSRQGQRNDLTSCTECTKLDERTTDAIGESFGLKGRQVSKYIRLTYLSEELLSLVDSRKIPITIAVDISYFDSDVQHWIYEYVKENGFLKPVQIQALKEYGNLENITQYVLIHTMNEALPKTKDTGRVALSGQKLKRYFPAGFSSRKREEIIIHLLEQWVANGCEKFE